MDITTKAIVIRKTEYRENTALVTLFCEDRGVLSATAHGIHSIKNGVASAIQPYTYGEFTLSERNGRFSVKSAQITETFGSLTASYDDLCDAARIVKTAMALFGESNIGGHDAFILLYSTLSHLAYSQMNHTDIYIYFVLYAAKAAGLCPHITKCAVCGKSLLGENNIGFSSRHGGAVCGICANAKPITLLSLEAMRRMLNVEPLDMGKIVLPENVRAELLTVVNEYAEQWF